ncbi:MAG: DUF2760 domain-containing protein [Pirellulales bacterium]
MIRLFLAGLVGALIWGSYVLSGVGASDTALISGGLVVAVLAAMAGQAFGAYTGMQEKGQSKPQEKVATPERVDTDKPSTSNRLSTGPAMPPVQASKPSRSEAITLLATLQREARFVDLVQESLTEYSDAQVGAAARDVLRDCRTVLDRFFDLHPVVDQPEGTPIEIGVDQSTGRYRMTGADSTGLSNQGSLVHHGWEARQCHLPMWSGSEDLALLVVPAELEKS